MLYEKYNVDELAAQIAADTERIPDTALRHSSFSSLQISQLIDIPVEEGDGGGEERRLLRLAITEKARSLRNPNPGGNDLY